MGERSCLPASIARWRLLAFNTALLLGLKRGKGRGIKAGFAHGVYARRRGGGGMRLACSCPLLPCLLRPDVVFLFVVPSWRPRNGKTVEQLLLLGSNLLVSFICGKLLYL